MGLTYAQIKDKPQKLLACTGLTRTEFETLLGAFEEINRQSAKVTQQGKSRQRKPGGGRKATLALADDRLLFILFYLKTFPLQEVLGEPFDLEISKVNERVHRLLPQVRDSLDKLGVLPERDAQAFAKDQAKRTTSRNVILDGTERRRQRPKVLKNCGCTTAAKRRCLPIRTW